MATPEDRLGAALKQAANALHALAGADVRRRPEALEEALVSLEQAREASLAAEREEQQTGVSTHPDGPTVVDLSVLVAKEYPCTWPLFVPPLIVMPANYSGPGPNASEILVIDEHTGTHFDAPNHFVPPPSSGLPNAFPAGAIPSHEVPLWRLVGEACVIDIRDLQTGPRPGVSQLIPPERVREWERAHRNLGPGDIVLFRSGYSDTYYKPFPAGSRFSAEALDPFNPTAPGWPSPSPECMEYLAQREVSALGIDSPNIGPVGELAPPVHVAGQKYGLIWTEVLTNLSCLPPKGAFFAVLPAKHAFGSGAEARALAIAEGPDVHRLIEAARRNRVVDLTVLLHEDLPVTWPGQKAGEQHVPYIAKALHNWDQFGPPAFVRTHVLDSQTGTHLVPPAYAAPPPNGSRSSYAPKLQAALQQFEHRYGTLHPTDATADRVNLDQLVGHVRVIDVTHLVGTTNPSPGNPQGPVIRVDDIKVHEQKHGRIRPGEIVLFHSAHSDRFCQPFPQGESCLLLPLVGLAEGWPAPDAETVLFLADERKVRCIGTDGPSMGPVNLTEAWATYWAAASRGVCFVEYLTNLGQLPPMGAYFLFGPVKVRGSHGGHGRALALLLTDGSRIGEGRTERCPGT